MKKILLLILVFVLVPNFVFADANFINEAEALNELGLFWGTDRGFELDSTFTRAQGATMIVRMMGKQDEALDLDVKSGFEDIDDVDHWSMPYVAYCAREGITRGTSNTTFSPEQTMSMSEYITLLLRALGYVNVNPDTAYIAAAEFGLLSSGRLRELEQSYYFTRGKMTYISYNALKTKGADGQTLIESLIVKGAVSEDIARLQGLLATEDFDLHEMTEF